MMLRALSVKNNSAWQLFLATVKKNIGITALITAIMLLACPGYVLVVINDYLEYATKAYNFDYSFITLNIFITVITCAIAVVCCFINFAFLYSKKSGDVYFSLPLTRNGLLFSRLIASVFTVLPSIILCYGSMGLILLSRNVNGDITKVFIGMLLNILLVIMCSCVTMLFIICAGSVTDLLISFFGVNIGIFAVSFIFFLFCDEILTGFYFPEEGEFLTSMSPYLYGFVTLVNLAEKGFAYSSQMLIFVIRNIATVAVSLAVSVLLFKKRKSEKCTCAYAYKGMYYLCALLVGFVSAYLVGMLFGSGRYNIFFFIFGIIGALLGAVTFGLITDRGFKTIKSSLAVGGISFAIMLSLMIVLYTDGLGYTSHIPNAESIKTVSVDFDNVYIEFSNPELVIALHEKAIASEKVDEIVIEEKVEITDTSTTPDDNYEQSKATYIRFEYTLKNGSKSYRRFLVKTKDCADELIDIFCSDKHKQSLRDKVESFAGSISVYGYYGEYEQNHVNTSIKKSEAKAIIDAYISDMPDIASDVVYANEISYFHIDSQLDDYRYVGVDIGLSDNAENTYVVIEELQLAERTKQNEEEIEQFEK